MFTRQRVGIICGVWVVRADPSSGLNMSSYHVIRCVVVSFFYEAVYAGIL